MNIVIALFMFLIALPAMAQSYYGEFGEGPRGEFRDSDPWQEFVLSDDFVFNDPNGLEWKTPNGVSVNGASIPPMFWSLIGGPFTGRYLKASVIHDYYVETRTRTAYDTHRNFYYGMRANNVPAWQAKAMYWAVKTFGESWVLTKSSRVDGNLNPMFELASTFEVEQQSASVARQSFLEVARNLKTSEGEILRVTASGAVEATLDAIDTDAFGMQRALTMSIPLLVGEAAPQFQAMMADFSGVIDSEELTFDSLPEWPDGEIPVSGGMVAQNFRDFFIDNEAVRDFDLNLEDPG